MEEMKCPFCQEKKVSAGQKFQIDDKQKVWVEVKSDEDSLPDQPQKQLDVEKSDSEFAHIRE